MGNRYTGGELPPAPSDTTVAGVLPVKVSFPIQGEPNAFRGVLVPQDTALELSLYTVPSWLIAAGKGAVAIVAIGVGLVASILLAWRARAQRCYVVTAAYAAVVLVLWWNLDAPPAWVTYGEAAFALGLIRPLVRHLTAFRDERTTAYLGGDVALDDSEPVT
jgi:hypothetical protein